MQPWLEATVIRPDLVLCIALDNGNTFTVSTVVCPATITVLHLLRSLHGDALQGCFLLHQSVIQYC